MVQKRPFDDEETFEVSSKHPRQTEDGNKLFSSLELGFSEGASLIPDISGGTEIIQSDTGGDEKLVNAILTKHQGSAEDIQSRGPGCISISSWPSSSTTEEDSETGTPVHNPLYSESLFPEPPTRQLYALLMEYPPQKSVLIGQNHQADVPVWVSQRAKGTANIRNKCEVGLPSEHISGNEHEKLLLGTCVIPMPHLRSSVHDDSKVGNGRNDCLCKDKGSVRCVRQHIIEAREELKEYLGKESLKELGFFDMGEIVADKWRDVEEQLFHKIVYSNPASLGKNFWNILSVAFPYRTKKDIVSYYFNVFVLRRRAVQNRCHGMNIDSDNDEWQGSANSSDNESGMSDEDEDSVVESPAYHGNFGYNQSQDADLPVYEEEIADGTYNDEGGVGFVCATNISEAYSHKVPKSSCSNPSSQLQDEKGDREVQDDSCTSSDTGAASQVKVDNEDHWGFNESKNGSVHEYALEPCNARVWDAGCTSYQNKVDLLPTCSIIEEIFGDGTLDCK